MSFHKGLIALGLCCASFVSQAQIPDSWRDLMEKYTENQEQEVDYQDLLELLSRLSENKINLNKSGESELRSLFFLESEQIQAIADHIQKFGPLLTLQELQVIDALDPETIRLMLPFVSVDYGVWQPIRFSDLKKYGKHEISQQFESERPLSKGYEPATDSTGAPFSGSPERWVTRYRFTCKDRIQAGISAEKDPGESFHFRNGQKGYDFYSGFVSYQGKGVLKYAIAGDYQVSFGQMLTLGTGLAFGKSAAVTMTKRNYHGIRPYRSVNENSFMRGGAIQLGYKNFTSTLFYSRLRQDGSISEDFADANSAEAQVSALNLTGWHRTNDELNRKRNLLLQTGGINVHYKKRGLLLGVTGVMHQFDPGLMPADRFYNVFYERGNTFGKIGFYYDRHYRNVNLYGESSLDLNGSSAHVHGFLVSLGKSLDMNVFYRNYARNFTALLSNGIGESSQTRNEEGFYWGVQYKINRFWSFSGYYDVFRFPWARYQSESPSAGREYLTELQYKPSKKSLLYIRMRQEFKSENDAESGAHETQTEVGRRKQIRFHAEYPAGDFLRFKTRMEWSQYDFSGSTVRGSMLFQDVQYKPETLPLTFSARTALFQVEDYEARIYAFENDVPYSFSVAMLQNSGIRNYFMVRWHVKRGLDCWMRVYATHYNRLDSISSGLNTIEGNRRGGISMVLKYSF